MAPASYETPHSASYAWFTPLRKLGLVSMAGLLACISLLPSRLE